jgi:DNA-binding transcriptional regulator YdaS (Cro superfamily)
MTKQELLAKVRNQTELAQLLGIKQSAISQWKEIPKARLWQLKVLKPEWFK